MPGVRVIPLTQGRFAIVNEEDYAGVKDFTWYASRYKGNYRAERWAPIPSRGRHVYMHRQIMNAIKGEMIDHRNGNGLDNRRENLRRCTNAQNAMNRRVMDKRNTSGHRGVYWDKARDRWVADISVKNKVVHLGRFKSLDDAAMAYKCASLKHYGEFSPMDASTYASDVARVEAAKAQRPGSQSGWFKKGSRPGQLFEFQPKTHCIRGHEFTPENTRTRMKDGHQYKSCRTCLRAAKKARRIIT